MGLCLMWYYKEVCLCELHPREVDFASFQQVSNRAEAEPSYSKSGCSEFDVHPLPLSADCL